MSDLKELLEPLRERQMPDRWDEIGRRQVAPVPEPRRSRAGAFVVAAAVALVAIAVIVRLSPLGGSGEVREGPLPPMSFTSDAGWSASIPSSWFAAPIDLKHRAQGQGVISNTDPSSFLYAPDPVPNATTIGFPADGVAIVVSKAPLSAAGFAPVSTPVSLPRDAERSSGADGSTLLLVIVQGPEAVYSLSVRAGRDASAVDIEMADQVAASLTFTSGSPST